MTRLQETYDWGMHYFIRVDYVTKKVLSYGPTLCGQRSNDPFTKFIDLDYDNKVDAYYIYDHDRFVDSNNIVLVAKITGVPKKDMEKMVGTTFNISGEFYDSLPKKVREKLDFEGDYVDMILEIKKDEKTDLTTVRRII